MSRTAAIDRAAAVDVPRDPRRRRRGRARPAGNRPRAPSIRARSGKTMAHAKCHRGSIYYGPLARARISGGEMLTRKARARRRPRPRPPRSTRSRILTAAGATFLSSADVQLATRSVCVCLPSRVRPSCYHKTGQLTESRADPQLSDAHARPSRRRPHESHGGESSPRSNPASLPRTRDRIVRIVLPQSLFPRVCLGILGNS